jgi:beta-mannanase
MHGSCFWKNIDREKYDIIQDMHVKRLSESTTILVIFMEMKPHVMWWALQKHKISTKYITLIKDMYV